MKGYVSNIERRSRENNNFREVLYTTHNCQLVLMSLVVGEDIGEEVHDVDQFLRVEQGTGTAILDGVSHGLVDGSVVIVPAGTKHNLVNTGSGAMKLYSLYMPAHHQDGTIHKTKADAQLALDGNCGLLTMTATKEWQLSAGLVVDGLLGFNSRVKAVSSQVSVPNGYAFGTLLVKQGTKGEDCKAWQKFFNDKADAQLALDGNCGPLTMTAAKQWQQSEKLVADGLLGFNSRVKAAQQ